MLDMADLENRSVEELEVVLNGLQHIRATEDKQRRDEILAVTELRDKKAAEASLQKKLDGMSRHEREALMQKVAASSVAATSAVGTPQG